MNKKLFIKLVICILSVRCVLISCATKVSSPSSNLNILGDYYIFRESIDNFTLKAMGHEGEFHTVIPANVSQIACNDEFIMAKQLGVNIDEETMEYNENNYKEPVYWIIDLKNNDIFNRLKEEEFKKLRENLKIPRELKLKLVNDM